MKIYIQTRGKISDYTFIGGEPQKKWWREPIYEQGTSFEKPTLIIENNANECRCYISGILSNRRDRVNTPIRYTIVIDEIKATAEEVDNILLLISSALQAFSSPSSSLLQEALDNLFNFDVDNYDKAEYIDTIKIIKEINEPPKIEQINEFLKGKKFTNFHKKIKTTIAQKESNKSSSAVAFLNLVTNKDYINSEIQPIFNKLNDLNSLSLLESLSSGKMFDDLTKELKKENAPIDNSPAPNKKIYNKKIRAIIAAIIIAILAILILISN